MKVTLYKDCKLNNKYKDIFYNKTYLNGYLALLDNRIVLNDKYIFSRNNDDLYIDGINISNFKQYNYMKIEDEIGTFYAFISNINWINEVYVISYEEDIMSNHIEDIHIRNSLLTGCKSLKLYKGNARKNIKYFTLPILPESNDYVDIKGYNIEDTEDDPEVCVVAKIQYYTLGTAGEHINREPVIGVIGYIILTDRYPYFKIKNSTIDFDYGIMDVINGANKSFKTNQKGEDVYYEIDKLYIVPKQFINIDNLRTDADGAELIVPSLLSGIYINYFKKYENGDTTKDFIVNNTYEKTIQYDYKNYSVGLYTRQINIVNNGSDIKIKVETLICGYGIQFLLNINNRIIDITEDFVLDVPFTQLNASALQIQRLQLQLNENELNNKISIENNNTNKNITGTVIGGVIGSIIGVGQSLISPVSGLTTLNRTIENISTSPFDIEKSNINIKYANERIGLLNKAVYCSSSLVANKFSYINAIYGLTLCKIVCDNESQIEQAIKLSGYLVREMVGDIIKELDIENLTDNYEVLKFDEINVYGTISQNYVDIIEKILLNGIRIWCQNNIGEII